MNIRVILIEISKGKMTRSLVEYHTCCGGLLARLKEKILVSLVFYRTGASRLVDFLFISLAAR